MAHPVFSQRNGRWIYFIRGVQDGPVEAFRIPAEGGQELQITHHGAFRAEQSPDGKLLYYGKHGASGLWSTPISGGEERQVLNSMAGMNWTVTSEGIYYFDFSVAPNQAGQVL